LKLSNSELRFRFQTDFSDFWPPPRASRGAKWVRTISRIPCPRRMVRM